MIWEAGWILLRERISTPGTLNRAAGVGRSWDNPALTLALGWHMPHQTRVHTRDLSVGNIGLVSWEALGGGENPG